MFAADSGRELEEVLASMPLRVWRTDQVTPLAPHPNDPALAPATSGRAPEFLTTFHVDFPDGTPAGDARPQRLTPFSVFGLARRRLVFEHIDRVSRMNECGCLGVRRSGDDLAQLSTGVSPLFP